MYKQQVYGLLNNKLASFNLAPNPDFISLWENRWDKLDQKKLLTRSVNLNEFKKPFLKYLKSNHRILEAGCGTGLYVKALHDLKFNVEGVDYARNTIQRVKKLCPELNVFFGDLCDLKEREDGYFDAYISLGVVEHDITGPNKFLKEANRLLSPGGIMLISIPHLNTIRERIKQKIVNQKANNDLPTSNFYQYYYSKTEFTNILNANGFSIIEYYPYSVYTGLIKDLKFFRKWHDNNFFPNWRLGKFLKIVSSKFPKKLKERYCHMMMYICIKNED